MSRARNKVSHEGHEGDEDEIFFSFTCFVLFVVGIIYFLRTGSTSNFRKYEE
jgi:hypothetical protein